MPTVWGGLAALPKDEVPSELLNVAREAVTMEDPHLPGEEFQGLGSQPVFNESFVSGIFDNVKRLNLGRDASDSVLRNISAESLPQLEVLALLYLAGGTATRPWGTPEALAYLEGALEPGTTPCARLREVDISFCRLTTYEMTLALRRLRPALRCIRRVPVWLTGNVQTPFLADDGSFEVHTYYADGSFRFSRSIQSSGFVKDVRDDELGVARTALQYTNFDSEGAWPPWVDLCYRVGVAVRRADGLLDEDSTPPGTLILQAYGGIRAPAAFPPGADASVVPPGGRIVMQRDGKVLDKDPDSQHPGHLMLSHMPVQPLARGALMPPARDVAAMARFVLQQRKWPPFNQDAVERAIHWELVGHEGDDVAWVKALR